MNVKSIYCGCEKMFSDEVRSILLISWIVFSAVLCLRNLIVYYKKRKNDDSK